MQMQDYLNSKQQRYSKRSNILIFAMLWGVEIQKLCLCIVFLLISTLGIVGELCLMKIHTGSVRRWSFICFSSVWYGTIWFSSACFAWLGLQFHCSLVSLKVGGLKVY